LFIQARILLCVLRRFEDFMAWVARKSVLLIVALIAGLLAWTTDAVALLLGWPELTANRSFPVEVYLGGVLAGLILNEIDRLNWSRLGVQLLIFLRHLGANAIMAAIGLGCALIVLYA
jgi:hypothetical protein